MEILSAGNTPKEMARKRREYFAAGVRVVWIVDPEARTVEVYTAIDQSTVFDATQTLDGGEVLSGFTLPLRELFAELDRLESLMSVWRPGSDIVRLNEAAGREPVVVGQDVIEALRVARDVGDWTDGAFDVTFAALSDAEAEKTARAIWRDINHRNLRENILPTRDRAHLILRKDRWHQVENVRLRKL